MVGEIIRSLSETKEPVSDVLRRTLVLAYRIKNEQLRIWVEKELIGYCNDEELPDYRKAAGRAKGLFLGAFGRQLNDQPLPSSVLKPEHRHWASEIRLIQPIAAYETRDTSNDGMIQWPADLVVMYQESFFQDLALNRAWLEIPSSIITGLVDTVRTRLLTFMLEIEAASPGEGDASIAQIPPTTVDRILNVTIMGGNNVFGPVNEFKSATVVAGDMGSLKEALRALGVEQQKLTSLDSVLAEDKLLEVDQNNPKTAGQKTLEWIGQAAKTTGKKGLEVGGAVMEEAIKRAVFGYLGFS